MFHVPWVVRLCCKMGFSMNVTSQCWEAGKYRPGKKSMCTESGLWGQGGWMFGSSGTALRWFCHRLSMQTLLDPLCFITWSCHGFTSLMTGKGCHQSMVEGHGHHLPLWSEMQKSGERAHQGAIDTCVNTGWVYNLMLFSPRWQILLMLSRLFF